MKSKSAFFLAWITLPVLLTLFLHGNLFAANTKLNRSSQQGTYQRFLTKVGECGSAYKGAMNIYRLNGKVYCEVPDKLLGREMLLVSRLSRGPGFFDFSGKKLQTRYVKWQKNESMILLNSITGIAKQQDIRSAFGEAIRNASFGSNIKGFGIIARNHKNTASLVDLTPLFTLDSVYTGFPKAQRKQYHILGLDPKRSYVLSVNSFDQSVEVRILMTYFAKTPNDDDSFSAEMCYSFVLLPDTPMKVRSLDHRVGYYSVVVKDYARGGSAGKNRFYITRWRLEPSDPKAYFAGKTVEPVKPIVFYLDPATPKKWRPYIKKGVEDWNVAFEAAGFKNAIIVKKVPEPGSDFKTDDIRYSVIRFCASEEENSLGARLVDPRTGEILGAEILFSANMLRRLQRWYFVQTAAANPEARRWDLDDAVMGKLIRSIISHEVGHCLGLQHNMLASSAFPVESLRSGSITRKMGIAASIMDYARFNYVAQPGDRGVRFIPKISDYDIFAIKYGYRLISRNPTAGKEEQVLNEWILKRSKNKNYLYSDKDIMNPDAQEGDLGDDPVKAGTYGMKNLEYITGNLLKWQGKNGDNYNRIKVLYEDILRQWHKYATFAAVNIGGVHKTCKAPGQDGPVYSFVPGDIQKKSLRFLDKYAFRVPEWLIDESLLSLTHHSGAVEVIRLCQCNVLNLILNPATMQRLIEAEARHTVNNYPVAVFIADVRKSVWSELDNGKNIDTYRRNLQRGYLERMEFILKEEPEPIPEEYRHMTTVVDVSQSDLRMVTRKELRELKKSIQTGLGANNINTVTQMHLQDILTRIDHIIQ